MAKVCVISASPRTDGRCFSFAEEIFNDSIKHYPDQEHFFVSLADLDIQGCVGCNACKSGEHTCKFGQDDVQDIIDCIDECELLEIVSPIYFAGLPSQFKALLDRLQPKYWKNTRHSGEPRDAFIHLIGDGGDPYGADGAILTLKSALDVAGFYILDTDVYLGKEK